jgi:hypothetical protein
MEEPFTSWIVPELCPSVSMPLNMNLFAFSLYVGSPGKEDVCSVGLLPEAVSVLLSTLVVQSVSPYNFVAETCVLLSRT